MNTKSKIFFLVFSLLFVGSIAVTYYRYFVLRDYMIEAQADCDPSLEACFVAVCDPESEECSGDPEQDTTYYSVIHRNARNIPFCNPSDEGCDALVCPEGEVDCRIDFCDPQTAPEGTVCNDPTTYTLLHPAEETEDTAGDEGDAAPGDTNESEQPSSGEGDVGSDVPVK